MISFTTRDKVLSSCLCVCICFLLITVSGCKEKPAPPQKPAVVKQRIAQDESKTPTKAQEQKPSKDSGGEAAEKKAVQSESTAEIKDTKQETAAKTDAISLSKEEESVEVSGMAAKPKDTTPPIGSLKSSITDETKRYVSAGKIDPFLALFKDGEPGEGSKKKKPRRPLTPLEKIDISQLKLVAVIRAESGNRALVEDATGKGYVIVNGTRVGIGSGKVVDIFKDRVVIEESQEDLFGRNKIATRELKLQKPFGEE